MPSECIILTEKISYHEVLHNYFIFYFLFRHLCPVRCRRSVRFCLSKNKLENVPPYSCDIKVKIDVSFINIKERTGKMVFKNPEEIDYKIKGFAFLPKNEMGATTTDLFNSEFIAISLGYEHENEIIKVIPMDINSEIVTGQFWINSKNLISEMILITKDKGSYSAKLSLCRRKI